jgi:hypothetical protein
MAYLVSPEYSSEASTHDAESLASPFYSRAYGGYTAAQEKFYRAHIGSLHGKVILDPMAGQAFLLAQLALAGARVWAGDINPAVCLLAALRSPALIRNHDQLYRAVLAKLKLLKATYPSAQRPIYVDSWLSTYTNQELQKYRQVMGLLLSPFEDSDFWRLSPEQIFAAALPVLAARDIACFRTSDNLTWIKRGGLQREGTIVRALNRALHSWVEFAAAQRTSAIGSDGELVAQRIDCARADFGFAPRPDVIITSPPYANRLDYTRMWAPESEVAAAMWCADTSVIKARQIGSTVVRGTNAMQTKMKMLPASTTAPLAAIREDKHFHASEDYYYPFFRNYAVTLTNAIQNMATRLKRRGVLIIFVRDTVRKDVLFPTGRLVEDVLSEHNHRLIAKERHIVRHHVGLRRRNSSNGLYGIGQQEWWLAFRKG